MTAQTENPAALAGADRALNIKALSRALDRHNPTEIPLQSLAARMLMYRFRLSPNHARVVCELAGIGDAR